MKADVYTNHGLTKTLAGACTAVLLACLLLFPAGAAAKRGLPDDVVETSCGEDNTGGSMVLIAVGTRYGRTFKIAEKIGEVLCANGFQVDMRFVQNVAAEDLAYYDAVILGSNIYTEEWNTAALAFLESNRAALAQKQVAYYCVNALLGMDFEDAPELVQEHYLDPMYEEFPEISPLDVKAFAGAVNYRTMLFLDWIMMRLMFMPGGDWTDWDDVGDWAETISLQLD